jgi:hypothetical protein
MGGTIQTLPNEETKSSSHGSLNTHPANFNFELVLTLDAQGSEQSQRTPTFFDFWSRLNIVSWLV